TTLFRSIEEVRARPGGDEPGAVDVAQKPRHGAGLPEPFHGEGRVVAARLVQITVEKPQPEALPRRRERVRRQGIGRDMLPGEGPAVQVDRPALRGQGGPLPAAPRPAEVVVPPEPRRPAGEVAVSL